MKPAIQYQERMRPSEINGCVVQNVSYLDEIDDENVLAALEKLRRTSFAMSTTHKENHMITTTTPSSSTTTTTQTTTNTTAPATTVSSPNLTQSGPPEADDVSIVSSIISYHRNCTEGSEKRKESINKAWDWLGVSLTKMNCLSVESHRIDGITAAVAGSGCRDNGNHSMKNQLKIESDPGGQRKHLPRLSELKKHLVKCGGGALNDYDDTDSINGHTVETDNDETLETNNDDISFSVVSHHSKRNINPRGNSDGNNNLKMKLKYHLYRFMEAAGEMLEGVIGKDDDDTLTLYGHNNNNNTFGDDSTIAETLTTTDSSLFSSLEDSTIVEAPDDEISQRFAMAGVKEKGKIANKIDPVFSMDGDDDDGGCVEVMPQQFVIIGYDPPVDDKK
jgi:hypothetical protein